jgi:cation transport regulator
MPYPSNESLPPSVRTHLSVHAQDIYREAFNHARAAHAARTGRKKPPIASLGPP